MTSPLILSLQITLVGMGLVFAAILLLWAVMAVLVRLTTDKEEPAAKPVTQPSASVAGTAGPAVAGSGDRAVAGTAGPAVAEFGDRAVAGIDDPGVTGIADPGTAEMDRKRLAAALAVAALLAYQSDRTRPHQFPLPQSSIVSPWQAVMRSRALSQRSSLRR